MFELSSAFLSFSQEDSNNMPQKSLLTEKDLVTFLEAIEEKEEEQRKENKGSKRIRLKHGSYNAIAMQYNFKSQVKNEIVDGHKLKTFMDNRRKSM